MARGITNFFLNLNSNATATQEPQFWSTALMLISTVGLTLALGILQKKFGITLTPDEVKKLTSSQNTN